MKNETQIGLKALTTFEIGGSPLFYDRPEDEEQLRDTVRRCARDSVPFRVLGGGSNLLVDDGKLPFGVIHICSPGFDVIERCAENRLRVGAGARLSQLLGFCRREGLGGLEFLAGIPGTVGGALHGNAGAWGDSIGEQVLRVRCLERSGRPGNLTAEQLDFSYRTSPFFDRVITETELQVVPADPELVAERIAELARKKAGRHPTGQPNAGCVFKNADSGSAGRLLDMAGMKGVRVGGASVSTVHANFICNVSNASARDVTRLIGRMQEAVRQQFGVELELEVQHWPREPRAA